MQFSCKDLFMEPSQETSDLLMFTKETLERKLYCL